MKLFISYARSDKQWVYDLARGLKEQVDSLVWYDRDVSPGQRWWDEILRQIEECDCVIVILTPAYVKSVYCTAELDYSLALNKPIIPILMKKCDIPPLLGEIQYLDVEDKVLLEVLLKCSIALKTIEVTIVRGGYSTPTNKPPRPLLPGQTDSDANGGLLPPFDEMGYRRWLRERTEVIDIRGIGAGNSRHIHRFPLLSLYIPLHARASKARHPLPSNYRANELRISLEKMVMSQKYTIIIGDPGAGKTTFLNYLARTWVTDNNVPLPLLMHASDVYDYISKPSNLYHRDLAWKWLVDYWYNQSEMFGWGFSKAWLNEKLQSGEVSLLLDSLDELPDHDARVKIAHMIDSCTRKWPESQWVIASRPGVLRDKARPLDFVETTIDTLNDNEIARFIRTWVNLLFQNETISVDDGLGRIYEQELLTTIRDRRDVNFLAHNPVMLTSIVVVHWSEKKLPEGKADLYEAVIRWLLKTHDRNLTQYENQKIRQRFQFLALSMLRFIGGRRTTVGRQWAAEQLISYFDGKDDTEKIDAALRFLDQGEIDTGIIVRRNEGNLTFWHTSFQEYLAACEIASKTDDEQSGWWSIIAPHLPDPAWREVLRFVPVIFHRLGDERVDLFIKRVLETRKNNSLAETARVVGFLGLILYDLSVYGYSVKRMKEYVQARDQVMQIFKVEGASLLDFHSRYDAAIALGRSGDPRLFDSKENLVTIPGGVAYIGAQDSDPTQPHYDEFAEKTEQPCHFVYSPAFQIGRYPVTIEEYTSFIEDGGYLQEDLWDQAGWIWRIKHDIVTPSQWDKQVLNPNCPVVYLSWHEANAYCNWLSSHDEDMNYHLPTEAEWEYMARHGQSTYSRYVFGNISPALLSDEMNWKQDRLTPVGLFPLDSTIYGVMDVNGNIFEWVYDQGLFSYTAEEAQASLLDELVDDVSTTFRARRGGGWDDIPSNHRTAYRSSVLSSNRYDDTGFRVLCTRKPIPIKGALPTKRYTCTMADIYARHANTICSREEANRHLQNYVTGFALSMNADDIIYSLFPHIMKKKTFGRLPCVLGAMRDKFDFNLLYQDTRIKLAVEEKLGEHAKLKDYQQDARNLMEVVATILSTEGIECSTLWQDLTDNDLDGIICAILNSYDPSRNQHLLEIGYETNKLALMSLEATLAKLNLRELITYQVFSGTVWWLQVSDFEGEHWLPEGNFEIDDRKYFEQDVLTDNCHMVFVFDDNGELIWDLALIQFLLKHNDTLQVTGVICNQVMNNNANWHTLETVLQEPIFQDLADSPRFKILREDNFRPSIDPNYCSEELLEIIGSCDLVFIKGVAGFETIQELPVDTYYAFVVYSDDSRTITGYKKGSGIFVRIPPGNTGYVYQKQQLRDLYPMFTRNK